MYRLIRILFFVFLVVAVMGFALRNYFLGWALPYWVHYNSSLNVAAESVDFSQFYPPRILAYDVTVRNPSGFGVENAVKADKLSVELNEDVWWGEAPRATDVVLEIEQLTLVRNADGKINLKELPVLQPATLKAGKAHPLFINDLDLSIDEVLLLDQTGDASGLPMRFRVDVRNAKHQNIIDRGALEAIILEEALRRIPRDQLPDGLLPNMRSERRVIIEW